MRLFVRNAKRYVDMPLLAKALVDYRLRNQLTQSELAVIMNYTQDNISEIETGRKNNIANSTIRKLEHLGIEINYM